MNFKGRPVTKERLGWWLRIALTHLFGRQVRVQGGDAPIKILPCVWKGELLLMGLEKAVVQSKFTNQYTLILQNPERIHSISSSEHSSEDLPVHCVILGHQRKTVIENVFRRFQEFGPTYHNHLAYGGTKNEFDSLDIENRIFIEDPSLRGPGQRMSHLELIEKSWKRIRNESNGEFYLALMESDLLPLKHDYLDSCITHMRMRNADFGAKDIRHISRSNSPFLLDAVSRNIITDEKNEFLHSLGAFYIIKSSIIPSLLEHGKRWKGLYFEIMFPSAAFAAGARMLSFDQICDDLKHVVYRPEHTSEDVAILIENGCSMAHPVKPE
jgi:hypothetical protein